MTYLKVELEAVSLYINYIDTVSCSSGQNVSQLWLESDLFSSSLQLLHMEIKALISRIARNVWLPNIFNAIGYNVIAIITTILQENGSKGDKVSEHILKMVS